MQMQSTPANPDRDICFAVYCKTFSCMVTEIISNGSGTCTSVMQAPPFVFAYKPDAPPPVPWTTSVNSSHRRNGWTTPMQYTAMSHDTGQWKFDPHHPKMPEPMVTKISRDDYMSWTSRPIYCAKFHCEPITVFRSARARFTALCVSKPI